MDMNWKLLLKTSLLSSHSLTPQAKYINELL